MSWRNSPAAIRLTSEVQKSAGFLACSTRRISSMGTSHPRYTTRQPRTASWTATAISPNSCFSPGRPAQTASGPRAAPVSRSPRIPASFSRTKALAKCSSQIPVSPRSQRSPTSHITGSSTSSTRRSGGSPPTSSYASTAARRS